MIMKKAYASLFVFLLLMLTVSSASAQSCGSMNVSSSGGYVAPQQYDTVYTFNVRCVATYRFTFEDRSGNNPRHFLEHIIERNTGGSWQVVSVTTSMNARSVTRTFSPTATGEHRYRIRNIGDNTVRTWAMTGTIPTISIFP
ncbi:hypothetical protein [Vreelandella hamiltonii]|uniref:Uncharacterized protein n=1 Tax=Halomonas johnsoniae TaxID=502832 RepID=A0ABQ2WTL2_9GAMM|nr:MULTISPECIES: hypothetical protein [Halomonas]GGW71723.1 hypothetical protein GCM10007158_35080 [Halomonas johnsoniae]